MYPYVALSWHAADEQAGQESARLAERLQHAGTRWTRLLDARGLIVFAATVRPASEYAAYSLAGDRGVVLGKLFRRGSALGAGGASSAVGTHALDEAQTRAIVDSGGRRLIDAYWGAYVAFIADARTQYQWVVRDPSGGLPCQRRHTGSIDLYFSRIEDLEALALSSTPVNHDALCSYLLLGSTCTRTTLLADVETVLPGECVERHAATTTQLFYWNPRDIASRDPFEDFEEVARLTREVTRDCVHAWASPFDGILLSLSGGLDSSVIAACLADAPHRPHVLCRNVYGGTRNTDERHFARLVARHIRSDLLEDGINTAFDTSERTSDVRSLYPLPWPIDLADQHADDARFSELGLRTVFNGDGGDEIFFRGGSFPGAVDFAWVHGFRPALMPAALDDATLDEKSVWFVLKLAWHYGQRRASWHLRDTLPAAHMPLMKRDCVRAVRDDPGVWHPLYRDTQGIPPGKFQHAFQMTYGTARTHLPIRAENAPLQIAPLVSQPLLELSLRTPLYVLRQGGRDRSVVRRAFASELPREIVTRRSKVFGNTQLSEVVAHNARYVKESLLGGHLSSAGILDRPKLETVLSGSLSGIQSEITELCSYMAVETWMRSWA